MKHRRTTFWAFNSTSSYRQPFGMRWPNKHQLIRCKGCNKRMVYISHILPNNNSVHIHHFVYIIFIIMLIMVWQRKLEWKRNDELGFFWWWKGRVGDGDIFRQNQLNKSCAHKHLFSHSKRIEREFLTDYHLFIIYGLFFV